ncbi:MAG: leucine-rich repeat protein [Treponema sp.]|nr:leucine-rich repeat protein [Treponema sp.]
MRRYSRLAIMVSHVSSDETMTTENDVVHLTNGNTSVEVSDFESALHMLPPGSEVAVVAQGTVGNTTVHNLSRIIRESNVLVTLDLSSVTELSRVFDSPFQGNKQLLAMHFPCNLLSINTRAFAGCTSLASVIIPATVIKIGVQAFAGCTQLHHLEFKRPSGWKCGGSPVEAFESPFENPSRFVFDDSSYFDMELNK